MSLSTFIVSHDQMFIKNNPLIIPNSKYIFVGNGPFDLIIDDENVIIARNLPDNLENQKYLLSFTAWYLIIKNNLCSTSHLAILEYDCKISDDFYQQTMDKILEGYEAISYMKWTQQPVDHIITGKDFQYLNQEILKIGEVQHLKNQSPWFHTTNQCMSLALLKEFVDWYFELQKHIQLYDFLYLSWYHERFYSMYIHNKKHICIDNIASHEFLESHALTGANSLFYPKWQLYLELHRDVKACGYDGNIAKNHFVQYGQKEGRLLRIPNFNWQIYLRLNPSAQANNELTASLHYLQNPHNLIYPSNFDWKDYVSEKLVTKDDITLKFLQGQLELKNTCTILLTATVDVGNCCFVDRRSVTDRIKDYTTAVDFYLQKEYHIVFVDNSGYDLSFLPDNDKLEKISFKSNESAENLGKGHGERNSVNYAIQNSQFIKQSVNIVKITGRLIIDNITQIIDKYQRDNAICGPFNIVANRDLDLTPGFTLGDKQVNTQIYIFNKQSIEEINKQTINDKAGLYMEHAIFNLANNYNMLRPKIIGISATINKAY